MNQIRLCLIKMIRWVLVKMGRGGSLPGNIAYRLDPNILKKFKMPEKVILVTGTNGKTTTANLIVEAMKHSGLKVIGNRKGDNLREGIITLLCANASLNYEVQADAVVLEVDELTIPRVFKDLSVTTFVVNNFFRDQLDRAGEMETIIRKIESVLGDYRGHLILNANDPNVMRLADTAKHATIETFAVGENAVSTPTSQEASEGKFCPRCGQPLHYAYYHYSHIGKFECLHDGFGQVKPTVFVEAIDYENETFTIDSQVFHSFQNAIYAIYNCAAVCCCMKVNGIDWQHANAIFKTFEMNEGRNETFDLNGYCRLNLVKNPTGANEVMKAILSDQNAKNICIILNDNDQDGTDVSWIWDAHFEMLIQPETQHIICCGKRAYDMALRLKYEGFEKNLLVKESVEEAVDCLKDWSDHAYVIATYTALQATRAVLRRASSCN